MYSKREISDPKTWKIVSKLTSEAWNTFRVSPDIRLDFKLFLFQISAKFGFPVFENPNRKILETDSEFFKSIIFFEFTNCFESWNRTYFRARRT